MTHYTTQPSFCGGCHLMQTRYVSWNRSVHGKASITCFQCHSDPGFIDGTISKLSGIKYLYYDYMGYRDPQILHTDVSNEACMQCHTVDKMDEKIQTTINPVQHISLTPHKSHLLDLGLSCINCHGNIIHETLDGEGVSDNVWRSCENCHTQSDGVR